MERTARGALLTRATRAQPRLLGRLAVPLHVALAQLGLGLLALAVVAAGISALGDLVSGAPHLGMITTGAGQVVWLDPDGAAARGGIRAGDTLTIVASHPFSAGQLSSALASGGDIALGEGQPGSFATFFVTAGVPSGVALAGDGAALVTALVLWLSGLVTALSRRREPAVRLYALAALLLALALCAIVVRDGHALWSWLVLVPAMTAGLVTLLLAQLALIRRLPRLLVVVAAALTVPAVVVAGAGSFVAVVAVASAWTAITIGVVAAAIMAGPLLLHSHVESEPLRQRLRVMLLAGVLGLLPLGLWPGPGVVAALRGQAAPTLPLLSIPYVSPLWSALGLIPMGLLYSLLALGHDVRRLDRYARTLLSYLIAIILPSIGLLVVAPALSGTARLVAAAAALAVFLSLQRGTEHLLRRTATRLPPDYTTVLRLVEEVASGATRHDDLAVAVDAFPRLLRVRSATLLLRELNCADDQYRVVGANDNDGMVRLDAALRARAPDTARPVAPSALDLPAGAALLVRRFDAALWIPLWWDGDQRGALVLGPRLSDEPFGGDDLAQISTLAGLLALALNALEMVTHLRERTATLATLTHRLSQAHEEERAHLSRELHDVVAQELIALTRQLRRHGDRGAAPAEIWADMLAAAQDALAATRRICNGLRPAILDLGLVPALRDLVTDAAERDGGPEVTLTVDGAERRLAAELEFALFRVAQEGLTNALAHAHARQVRVEALFDGEEVYLRVRDDGSGFAVPPRFEDLPGDHLGLIGMRERLAECSGTLTVTSLPGRGTVLEAHVSLS